MSRMRLNLSKSVFFLSIIVFSPLTHALGTQLGQSGNGVELRLNTGMLAGRSHEYVYDADGSSSGHKGYKISELIWEMDTVPMAGLGLTVPVGGLFRINMDYWQNVGEGDGTMDDYDWTYVGYPWSHWSHHDNTTVRDVSYYDVNMDFDLHRFSSGKTKLLGILGYRRDHLDWHAKGGHGIYSVSTYRDTYVTFTNAAVCRYEQTFSTPYIGLGIESSNSAGGVDVTMHLNVRYSQWAHGEDIDHHYLRSLVITQNGDGGEWMGADLKVDFEVNPEWMFQLGYNYQKYSEIKTSKTYKKLTTGVKTYYPGDSGGLSNTSHMVNLGLKYLF